MNPNIPKMLRRLTGKKHIVFVDRGNTAIMKAFEIAKKLGKTKALMQDQGGWLTYKQFALKNDLMPIELKTDYGILNLRDLFKKADKNSVLIVNSLTGYFADQPMKPIEKICKKRGCLLINDASGSIGTKFAKYGDIAIGSFRQWKPINLGKGGFMAINDNLLHFFMTKERVHGVLRFIDRYISRPEVIEEYKFSEKELDALENKIVNLNKRLKFMMGINQKIKNDLKSCEILHKSRYGLNVVVKFKNEEEKNKIIKYCEENKYEYTLCPRNIRADTDAVCIEVKRLEEK
ncbi:DegT/DnrJ/EryC1/StrS family aminotransferase [Candidatus Woesearchaeota archaeon]|nr:DegT/DnrJ/EryC1/StrS family aminotransferase [Candidatus Woesearchaeota archaeon]